MKIKNSQVVGFLNGSAVIHEKRLPIKIGYAITRNSKLMESIATGYEDERKKILDKYAEKGENGEYKVEEGSYSITDVKGYEGEMQELLSIENAIELHMISFSDLEKCDSDQFDSLSMQDISLLDFMTTEE